MKIISTKPGDDNFYLFESLPGQLYDAGSIRLKQNDNINVEFLNCCFVLCSNGQPKARVALYNNPGLCYNNMPSACIGNYESVNDSKVSRSLLDFAFREVKRSGVNFVIGPMNGSSWDNYRFSTHHDHPNFLSEPYHHLYYNDQFLEAGFTPISKYFSSIEDPINDFGDPVWSEDFMTSGINIRRINMDDYEGELEKLYPFLQSSFKSNFLFTPTSPGVFYARYMEMSKIIHHEHTLIAEDGNSNIIGFIFCFDDLYNTVKRSLIIKTLVRDPSNKWKGLGYEMGKLVNRAAQIKGYDSIIHAFMKEDGASTITSGIFHGTIFKNYMLYGKSL